MIEKDENKNSTPYKVERQTPLLDQPKYPHIQHDDIGYYIPPKKPQRMIGIIERYTDGYNATPEVSWWCKIHGGK